MKIVFVTSTLSSGGSERVMSLLANELANRGHSIEIICLNRHVVFYPINVTVKMVFAENEVHSSFMWRKMFWFRKYIISVHPDVVIPFMTDVYSVTLLSLVGTHVPVISSERVDPRYSTFFYKLLRLSFVWLTTHLVVQTERIKEYYSKSLQKRTSVIYNPVSEQVFELGPVERFDRIISLGRLAEQKNFGMMIRAFAKISKEFPSYHLVIFGEGPLREQLENEIVTLGMENKIFLKGRTNKAIEELNQSKMFCMSTDGEGMSNALIEAICVGLPVLTTNVSGAEELVDNGKTGIITPIGDEMLFSKAMRHLLSDEAMMMKMGKENMNNREQFKLEYIVNKWENLIRKIVYENR